MVHRFFEWGRAFAKKPLPSLLFSACVVFLIVSSTSNLFLVLPPETYLRGLRVDYLLNKVYLADIALVLLCVSWVWQIVATKKTSSSSAAMPFFVILTVMSVAFASLSLLQPTLSGFWPALLTIFKLGAALYILRAIPAAKKTALIGWALLASLCLQSILGLHQFLLQRAVFPYYVFGEPSFAQAFKLDRAQLFGSERILPYGSLPHPNVLAGTLVVFWFCAWHLVTRSGNKRLELGLWCITPVVLLVLFLTQSLTAWVAATFVLVYVVSKNAQKVARWLAGAALAVFALSPWLLLATPTSLAQHASLSRRQELLRAGISLIKQHPVAGVGWGQSTRFIEPLYTRSEPVRFVQPVHHIGVLFLVENGLLGVALLAVLTAWQFRSVARARIWLEALSGSQLMVVAVFLLLGSFDHYLFTLLPGQLLILTLVTVIKISSKAT